MKKLADAALSRDSSTSNEAKTALRSALHFDALNVEYFLTLYASYRSPGAKEALQIFEHGRSGDGRKIAYPTAIAPAAMMKELPYVKYEDLVASPKKYSQKARGTMLWIKKMQAGTGSSMTRSTYLARMRGIPLEQVSIGAKGTDLYIECTDGCISLAEAQILQAISDAQHGVFAEVALQDIVSSETEESLAAIWNKPSVIDPSRSYAELVQNLKRVQRFGRSYQSYIPTIDEKDEVSRNRLAPGGHALFAVDALRAAYIDELRPRPSQPGVPVVSVLGNGEDLSSTPDGDMVGWVVTENIPIVMVTTDKTENDLKGGQIALVKTSDGRVYVTIVEQAQAKEAGQQKLFEQLGLREGDAMAFFNTNMALFNYDALSPKIKNLVSEIGEQEFLRVIAPDLILNKKSQTDKDGVRRTYTQLEGAMGSSLLRLDRYWRERFGEPIVHFINVSRDNRTRFFSPIKTAFDFFMQFHSDRFGFDRERMRLINKRPGELPSVTLNDKESDGKYWADVENVLNAFSGASILGLKSLEVEGRVSFRGAVLRGDVRR